MKIVLQTALLASLALACGSTQAASSSSSSLSSSCAGNIEEPNHRFNIDVEVNNLLLALIVTACQEDAPSLDISILSSPVKISIANAFRTVDAGTRKELAETVHKKRLALCDSMFAYIQIKRPIFLIDETDPYVPDARQLQEAASRIFEPQYEMFNYIKTVCPEPLQQTLRAMGEELRKAAVAPANSQYLSSIQHDSICKGLKAIAYTNWDNL